jgi:hypothetical protein
MSEATYVSHQLEAARRQPGTAEFLSTLLTARGHKCPHFPKISPGPKANVPFRLGFFHAIDGNITCLETNRICRKCYDAAVPEGFNVWSTNYPNSQQGNFYPTMIEAGTEGFEDNPTEESKVYDAVRMPASAEADEAFRWLQEQGKPFYIDQLHLTRPWNPNLIDRVAEDRRVVEENAVAYRNAAKGVAATGVGGTGPYTIAEQRILEVGNRLVVLPSQIGGHPWTVTHDETIEASF